MKRKMGRYRQREVTERGRERRGGERQNGLRKIDKRRSILINVNPIFFTS